jgi:7-cyano-7-deazaguanine synthase
MERKAVILLSGGLDSATAAAIAMDRGFTLSALTFNYGQRHDIEVSFAARLVSFFGIKDHKIITIPSEIFRTALARSSDLHVPKNQLDTSGDDIPVTYVPARNIIFLSYALAYAESTGAGHIFIGANAVDYSGYPDCRPEFFEAFARMAALGTKAGVEGKPFSIETPLIDKTKAETISIGVRLGVDYSLTHSCYDPAMDGSSCGGCDSCLLRMKGFREAGFPDPTKYRSGAGS